MKKIYFLLIIGIFINNFLFAKELRWAADAEGNAPYIFQDLDTREKERHPQGLVRDQGQRNNKGQAAAYPRAEGRHQFHDTGYDG